MSKIKRSSEPDHFLAEEQRLRKMAEKLLEAAKKAGATSAEVDVSVESGFTTTVRMGEVDTIEYQRDKGVGITVYFDQRKGSASTSDTSSKSLQETLQAACDIAQYTTSDPYSGLADKSLMATECPDLDLYHPWSITPEQAVELAKVAEAKGRAVDTRIINSEGASVSTNRGLHLYANSHGFIGVRPSSYHNFCCVLLAQDKKGMQRDYDYTAARNPLDLESADKIAQSAAKKTIARLSARRLKTCKVPVIFSADIARGLFGSFIAAVSGRNLYRESSFLLNSLGTSLFPEWMVMTEQPHIKGGLGSASYDSEGVRTASRVLVDNGILQGYVLSSYSARKLGMETTGNSGGVHNLMIKTGSDDLAQLLKNMGDGLLVTEVMGQGVNMVTGDYSRGASGFWVEKGEIAYPVEEFTIASNLKEMYRGIQGIATDVDQRGNIQTGSVLIDEMMIAGE